MRSFARLPLLLLGVAFAATPVSAQTTYTWGQNAGTAWATGGNWVGGTPAGSSSQATNNDIAQFGSGSTGTQMQMNFGTLGTPYYLGTVNILSTNTVAKTMGANTATAGVVQLNGTGANNLILSNASTSLFTLAPLAGGSGTGMSLRLGAVSSEIAATGGITISAQIAEANAGSGITKTGTGSLTLSGANTFTGGVTLNAGTLSLGNNAALGTGALTVGAVGTAINVTGTAATFANDINLTNTAGRVAFVTPNTSSTTLSGTISGGAANTGIATTTGTEWFFQGGASGQNTGALTITGNNVNWQGTINVQRGPLILGNANAAGTTVIRLDSNNPPAGALQLTGNFTVGNSLYLNSGAAQNIGVGSGLSAGIGGVIASNGALGFTKVGAGTLSLTGANTYSGSTVVSAGTLQVGDGGATGTLGSGAVTNNAALAFNRSDPLAVGNVIGGTGAVNQIGTGTTTLTGANTFTGALNVTAGTLALGSTGTLATNTNNVNGGVFDVSAVPGYTLAAGKTLTAGRATAATDVAGDFTLAGTLSIGGSAYRTATFANSLTLNGGTVAFDLGSALTAGGGVNDLVAVGGSLTLSGTSTINITQPAAGLTTGNYTLFTYGGGLTGGASNLTVGGAASGTTRQVFAFDTTTAAGSVLLNVTGSAANLTWTGTTNGNWDLVTTAGNFSGAADSRFYNLDTVTFNDSAATGAVALTGSLNPTSTTVDNSSLAYTFSGSGGIGGVGGLTKSGTGTLVLANSNIYSGGTTISGGTLQLGNGGTTGSIAGDLTNNGTLAFNRSDSVTFGGVVSGTGSLTQAGTGTTTLTAANTYTGGTTVSVGTLQIGNAGTTGSIAGAVTNNAALVFSRSNATTITNDISGTGSATYQGGGIYTVTGSNTYSGGTSVTAGGVNFASGTAFGTGTITFAAGVANQAGAATAPSTAFLNNTTAANTTLANNIVLPTPAAATTYSFQKTGGGGQINFTGDISGGNANTKLFLQTSVGGDNTTTYRFAGNNSFVATVEVWRGAVVVASANGLGDPTNLIRFNSNNNTALGDLRFETFGTFANPIEFVTGGGGPVNTNANNVTLGGVLSGGYAGGLTKLGTGSLTVTGDNTYTAGTTVNAGTLNVSNASGSGTGTGAVTVQTGGTLGGTGTVGGATTVQSGGAIRGGTAATTGTLTTGNVTVNTDATLAANLAAPGTSSTLAVGGNTLNLLNGSKLSLTAITGFSGAAGSYTLATLTDGNNLQLGGTGNRADGFSFGTYVEGTGASGAVVIDVSNLSFTLNAGDTFALNRVGNNLVLSFSPVPEPATVLAVGAAGLGLFGWARRRRQATATA